jgi:type VI secretion system protein ImpE
LGPAIEALGTELRMQPGDAKRRTFLFELLCFAGAYDRAEKQLDILADANKGAFSGALLYRAALHAQRTREELLLSGQLPARETENGRISGSLNGVSFSSLEDEDLRFGTHLEVFIAGSYALVPFRYIQRVQIAPPTRLRDLLWATALLSTTPDFGLQDLGEVLLPALAPGSSTLADDMVRLGRTTVWQSLRDEADIVPFGQKSLIADGEVYPLLSVRELVFTRNASTIDEEQ